MISVFPPPTDADVLKAVTALRDLVGKMILPNARVLRVEAGTTTLGKCAYLCVDMHKQGMQWPPYGNVPVYVKQG